MSAAHQQIINALITAQNAAARATGIALNSRIDTGDPLRRHLPAEARGADILFSSNYATSKTNKLGAAGIVFLLAASDRRTPENIAVIYGQRFLTYSHHSPVIDWLFLSRGGISPLQRLATSSAVAGYFEHVGGGVARARALAVLTDRAAASSPGLFR